jgi:hypothetical protein
VLHGVAMMRQLPMCSVILHCSMIKKYEILIMSALRFAFFRVPQRGAADCSHRQMLKENEISLQFNVERCFMLQRAAAIRSARRQSANKVFLARDNVLQQMQPAESFITLRGAPALSNVPTKTALPRAPHGSDTFGPKH